MGLINKGWYGMFVASGIWCLADLSSVSPSSEHTHACIYTRINTWAETGPNLVAISSIAAVAFLRVIAPEAKTRGGITEPPPPPPAGIVSKINGSVDQKESHSESFRSQRISGTARKQESVPERVLVLWWFSPQLQSRGRLSVSF